MLAVGAFYLKPAVGKFHAVNVRKLADFLLHIISNVILLEGIRLAAVSEGVYFLNAAPLNLSGADGSPCRAVLIDIER